MHAKPIIGRSVRAGGESAHREPIRDDCLCRHARRVVLIGQWKHVVSIELLREVLRGFVARKDVECDVVVRVYLADRQRERCIEKTLAVVRAREKRIATRNEFVQIHRRRDGIRNVAVILRKLIVLSKLHRHMPLTFAHISKEKRIDARVEARTTCGRSRLGQRVTCCLPRECFVDIRTNSVLTSPRQRVAHRRGRERERILERADRLRMRHRARTCVTP